MISDFYKAHRAAVAFVTAATALAMTAALVLRPDIAGLLGLATPGLAVALVWAVERWEKIEKYGGRALGLIARASQRAERIALSAEMQGVINDGRKRLLEEFGEVMPYPARVKFVRGEEDLAALRDGEVVIALRDPSRHAENTARAALAYVSTITIRPARPYVDRQVLAGVDFSLTKRILLAADRRALDYFIGQLWATALDDRPVLRDICHDVETIERNGLLTRILLVEFLELGRRLYGEFPPPAVHGQTVQFVRYLAALARKEPEQVLDLMFQRGSIRIGVVLVGDRELAETAGSGPYVARCMKNIRAGCDAVYLLARGARCDLVREVAAKLGGHGRVLAVDVTDYQVQMGEQLVPAVIARLAVEQRGYDRAAMLAVPASDEIEANPTGPS